MPKRFRVNKAVFGEHLRDDPEMAASYLTAALEDSDPRFLSALRDVAEAHRMAKVAESAGLTRETLYRTLSERGNPTLRSLSGILHGVGMRIVLRPRKAVEASRLKASHQGASVIPDNPGNARQHGIADPAGRATEMGHTRPVPMDMSSTATVALRLPSDLHTKAAECAKRDTTTLNQFLVSAIAASVGAEDFYTTLVDRIESRLKSSLGSRAINPHEPTDRGGISGRDRPKPFVWPLRVPRASLSHPLAKVASLVVVVAAIMVAALVILAYPPAQSNVYASELPIAGIAKATPQAPMSLETLKTLDLVPDDGAPVRSAAVLDRVTDEGAVGPEPSQGLGRIGRRSDALASGTGSELFTAEVRNTSRVTDVGTAVQLPVDTASLPRDPSADLVRPDRVRRSEPTSATDSLDRSTTSSASPSGLLRPAGRLPTDSRLVFVGAARFSGS